MLSPLREIAHEWALRCFGHKHVENLPLRVLRMAEEVVELAQAEKVPAEKLHALIDLVYARPVGNPSQEIGGILMTLNIYCMSAGMGDPDALFVQELKRCLAKPPEHFTKRNQEKLDLGMNL